MGCFYCSKTKDQVAGPMWRHQDACEANPENMPDVAVIYSCGHTGARKPFPNDPDGSKLADFLAERKCDDCFFVEYREYQLNRTPEQIAQQRREASAAFGPGVEVVNVMTGERYVTQ